MMYSAPIVCYVTDIWDWCLWNPFILEFVLCFIKEESKTASFNRSDISGYNEKHYSSKTCKLLSFSSSFFFFKNKTKTI